jgi:integrase
VNNYLATKNFPVVQKRTVSAKMKPIARNGQLRFFSTDPDIETYHVQTERSGRYRVDFTTNLVFVSLGKGKKDRVTVIGNRLKDKLGLYLEGRTNKFLFESNRNTKYRTRRIEQLCQSYKELAGVAKDLSPHTFRHLWNTALAAAGLSEERRAILAGHEHHDTQNTYTHLCSPPLNTYLGVRGASERPHSVQSGSMLRPFLFALGESA